jgi:hypothetical protein
MPADLEAFASGDDDAIWRRTPKRRLNDPRPVVLVPGVANRDARLVYDARERRLRAAIAAGDRRALEVGLAEAARLQVWRGHSLVGWEVFAENVLGLDAADATAARRAGAATVGSDAPAEEELVATWMRAEAGLVEACGADAAVHLVGDRLVFSVPVADAPNALSAMGRRATPLAKDQAQPTKSVVDRPQGMPRLSKLVERNED